jgi:hypothetical protein
MLVPVVGLEPIYAFFRKPREMRHSSVDQACCVFLAFQWSASKCKETRL